jgi:hypothetical protein
VKRGEKKSTVNDSNSMMLPVAGVTCVEERTSLIGFGSMVQQHSASYFEPFLKRDVKKGAKRTGKREP